MGRKGLSRGDAEISRLPGSLNVPQTFSQQAVVSMSWGSNGVWTWGFEAGWVWPVTRVALYGGGREQQAGPGESGC